MLDVAIVHDVQVVCYRTKRMNVNEAVSGHRGAVKCGSSVMVVCIAPTPTISRIGFCGTPFNVAIGRAIEFAVTGFLRIKP